METNNIYFPLCCLNFQKDISKTADLLISYGIIEFGSKLMNEIDLNDSDLEAIENKIEKYNIRNVNQNKDIDLFSILSSNKLGIILYDLAKTKGEHLEIKNYVSKFEYKYGKDCKVKVHKDLLFDIRDHKNIDERMFRIYCAVVSSIGNKPFLRIVCNTIAVRMLGFKSKEVYNKEKPKYKLLTSRQIKTTVDKLSETGKNFFAIRTYRNRLTFYSTKLRGKEFDEVLSSSLALNKAKKEVRNIYNQKVSTGVDEKLKQFREKLLSGESIKEIKSNMELFKAG